MYSPQVLITAIFQILLTSFSTLLLSSLTLAKEPISAMDIFKIAYASNPIISADGKTIAFHRYAMDIMTDQRKNDLWVIDAEGKKLRQISKGFDAVGVAAFTQSGDAIAFVAYKGDTSHIYVQQLNSSKRTELGGGLSAPANLAFSPDGKWLAFTMPVSFESDTMGTITSPPEGAEWAEPIVVETRTQFRVDGAGYLPFSRHQVFLIPTQGGAAQQLTQGQQDHNSAIEWLPDSSGLLLSINFKNNVNKPWDTDIVRLDLQTRQLSAFTTQSGPDSAPKISPDGKRIAWVGHQDKPSVYHEYQLYTAKLDGSDIRELTSDHDLSVIDFAWHPDNQQHYIQYEERGQNVLALLAADGSVSVLTDKLSGWELDQPYVQGQFSASAGVAAVTLGDTITPTELGVVDRQGRVQMITDFNCSLHNSVRLATVEERTVKSSVDQRELQYWIMRPPNFDANKS